MINAAIVVAGTILLTGVFWLLDRKIRMVQSERSAHETEQTTAGAENQKARDVDDWALLLVPSMATGIAIMTFCNTLLIVNSQSMSNSVNLSIGATGIWIASAAIQWVRYFRSYCQMLVKRMRKGDIHVFY